MSNQFNMTVSLKPDDEFRKLLDAIMFNQEKIIDLLQGTNTPLAEPQNAPQSDEADPVKETNQEPEKPQENASLTPLPDIGDGSEVPPPHIETMGTPVTESFYAVEDVQRKVVELSAAGKKVEVREIVTAYATRVSEVPADKLDEVMAKLIALEG
jgi:hypothetical protein